MPNTITLQDVIQWLETKSHGQVMCWDTFEPRHCLLVQYDQEHGQHTDVRSEYDRIVSDPTHRLREEYTGEKKQVIALFDRDLQKFNYALSYTSLRFRPTAGALLSYYHSGAWQEEPRDVPQYLPPDAEFNALHDGPDRPSDLPWRHRERLTFQEESYLVALKVWPERASRQDPAYGIPRYIDLQVAIPERILPFMYYEVRPQPPHTPGAWQCEHERGWGGWYKCSANLFDQDTITLTSSFGLQKVTVGVWQRQGEHLIRIQ